MIFLVHLFYVVFYISAIIYTCFLFTNAIEHLGLKLKLGNNATGSILAVIGTVLPETIIPLIAIFGSYFFSKDISTGQDIALGAIIGSPFMLSTLALFLLAIVLIIQKRKELNVDYTNILRDYKYFILAYIVAICTSFVDIKLIKILTIIFLLALYCFFVYRTIIKSKQNFVEEELEELVFCRLLKCKIKDEFSCVIVQLVLSFLALGLFSHLFVDEIKYFSTFLNVSPVILSLVITPFATELPECSNSVIWTFKRKDDLALANVIGAVVFQAMIPMSIGIALTPWKFSPVILLNICFVIINSTLFVMFARLNKSVKLYPLFISGIFYFIFLTYLFLK